MENEIVNPDAAVVAPSEPKPARIRNRRASVDASTIRDMRTLVRFAKTVTPANFADALTVVNRNHGVTHAARNVGRFTGHRIVMFQNVMMRDNAGWQLNDCQLAFIMRAEFPAGVGRVFTASPADGVRIVRGIRADYNRTGHGATWTRTEPSVSYGPARFAWPDATAKSA